MPSPAGAAQPAGAHLPAGAGPGTRGASDIQAVTIADTSTPARAAPVTTNVTGSHDGRESTVMVTVLARPGSEAQGRNCRRMMPITDDDDGPAGPGRRGRGTDSAWPGRRRGGRGRSACGSGQPKGVRGAGS